MARDTLVYSTGELMVHYEVPEQYSTMVLCLIRLLLTKWPRGRVKITFVLSLKLGTSTYMF